MLLGNYSVLHKLPLKFVAGSAVSVEGQLRSNFGKSGNARNKIFVTGQTSADKFSAIPTGSYPPYCWFIPQVSGQIASTGSRASGNGAVSSPGNLAGGINVSSDILGIGAIEPPNGSLIMFAVASLVGQGLLSSAQGTSLLQMAIDLSGSGSISSATGQLASSIEGIANLGGSSNMSANMGALAGALAALAGQGGIYLSIIRADGFMSADIAPATTVAADVIANAVWAALVSDSANPGSRGDAVLSASGGLVPATPEEVANAVWATASAIMLTNDASTARKMQTNKASISTDGLLTNIYEDDGVTLLQSFTISNDKNTRIPK
jgi:hypothetical protein